MRTLTQQVEAEVAKHPGVIAAVNEETGRVTTVMAPMPDAATNLSAPAREELERERKQLTQALRSMTPAARSKTMTRLNVIESEIRRGRSIEEAERRKRERETERKRERGELV